MLEVGSVPLGPNFSQLDIGEPSSGFTLGLRSASSLVVNLGQEHMATNDHDIPMEAPSMGVGTIGVDYQVDPPWIEHGDNGMVVQDTTTNKR